MLANGFELINTISVNLAKILLVVGMIYVVVKIITKVINNETFSALYERIKLPLYYLHKAGPVLATILGFIHGFVIVPLNQTYILTGWCLGICMIILSVLGIYLGFKNGWKPLDANQDSEWKKLRAIKWILTFCVFLLLFLHYLDMILGNSS